MFNTTNMKIFFIVSQFFITTIAKQYYKKEGKFLWVALFFCFFWGFFGCCFFFLFKTQMPITQKLY